MKERPILFSSTMVQAILQEKKTQTRRIIKPQPNWVAPPNIPFKTFDANPKGIINCPYGEIGDRLWVRETWGCSVIKGEHYGIYYQASYNDDKNWNRVISVNSEWYKLWEKYQDKKRPSIFMPRWASRILLEITDVIIERIQDISEEDALSEGVISQYTEDGEDSFCHVDNDFLSDFPSETFSMLWDSINKKRGYGWKVNPYVWVISFKVLEVKR